MVSVDAWKQQVASGTVEAKEDLFQVLGLSRTADAVAVRRAFKTLITKEHPDKGGDPNRFKAIKLAYDTLSDAKKREYYETTGKISRSAGEDFLDRFRGGQFGEVTRRQQQERQNLAEAITAFQSPEQSHTAGFEAWMRSRGENGTSVYTAETLAERFGVNKGSYETVAIPKAQLYKAEVQKAGSLREAVHMTEDVSSGELEWGQVLVALKYAPIDAADVYSVSLGVAYGEKQALSIPCTAGNRGFGTIVKVGPGVKEMKEDDWVIPLKSGLGTWQNLLVAKAADLVVLPKDCMPMEYASLSQQLCLAFRLLEDFGSLKPGDCVILNAATSTVGQIIIQLCHTLKLRTVAVISEREDVERTSLWLTSLGATQILLDKGSLKVELEQLKFFGKPKLALDAVGGLSAARLADALVEGGEVVIYGCLSGKPPTWPWQRWIFNSMQVRGFNFGAWMAKHPEKMSGMMDALGKLVKADQLKLAFTEYDLATEFEEAVDHALDRGTNTKALLRIPEVVYLQTEDS